MQTSARQQLVSITASVNRLVGESGVKDGICVVFVSHTTVGVTINETHDPSVCSDSMRHLNRLVPGDLPYAHSEGNSDAHIMSSLIGCSVTVPVVNGEVALGQWQGILLCEFDGPRRRRVQVVVK